MGKTKISNATQLNCIVTNQLVHHRETLVVQKYNNS